MAGRKYLLFVESKDTGLSSSSSYSYVVRAADTSGNVSGDSATVTATPQPTIASEQLAGSFKRTATSTTYTRTVQPGPLRAVAASLTVTLETAQGMVLGTRSGTSVDVQATATAAGAHSWTIAGANGVSYKLTISYTSA